MPIPGTLELIIILVIILLIFGAGKLPQVFGQLGKGVKEFRDASGDIKGEAGTTAEATTPDTPVPAETQQISEATDSAVKK